MRKSETTTINISLLLFFDMKKIIFCRKTYLKILRLYFYVCITVIPPVRLLEMQQKNTNFNIDRHWSYRRRTSTKNTQQWFRYFNLDFGSSGLLFRFLYFREALLIQKKNHLLGKVFSLAHKSNRVNLLKKYFSNYTQRYVHNLERNQKKSVCIGVEIFPNLLNSKLHGYINKKYAAFRRLHTIFHM